MAENRRDPSALASAVHGPFLAAQTLSGASQPSAPKEKEPGEERLPWFWRIFGGSLLSVAALVAVTFYEHQVSTINDLRNALDQRAKKEEFDEHKRKVWERFHELETTEDHVDDALRERCARLEQQAKDAEVVHNEIVRELQWLREATVLALKEKAGVLEQQVKADKEEGKDVARALQQLRDRMAVLEGRAVTPIALKPVDHQMK